MQTTRRSFPSSRHSLSLHRGFLNFLLVGLILFVSGTGCQAPDSSSIVGTGGSKPRQTSAELLVLHEGDVLKVSFPGASNLDTVQSIRRDGRIVLPILGEVQAAGLTPSALSAELVKLYAPQLVYKEVTVSVVSSSFTVFVSGAVLRPGKIVTDRPLTALEAIMEAGGFDFAKANLKEVVIIRDGRALPEKLNLKRILDGKIVQPFYLQPSDIVHVPDRLVLF